MSVTRRTLTARQPQKGLQINSKKLLFKVVMPQKYIYFNIKKMYKIKKHGLRPKVGEWDWVYFVKVSSNERHAIDVLFILFSTFFMITLDRVSRGLDPAALLHRAFLPDCLMLYWFSPFVEVAGFISTIYIISTVIDCYFEYRRVIRKCTSCVIWNTERLARYDWISTS